MELNEAMEDNNPVKRVLEFYSGIGGLRYSLEESEVNASVVEAFDINEVANDVYQHNFGHRPCQGNIQGLSVKQLDKYKADTWLMSPPCQPYTRQGLQKDALDARATSFLSLLHLLPAMASPPVRILVENVVGFENSVTHGVLLSALEEAGFLTQEFILSPLQFGIPYSRPRYFCLGKRIPEEFLQPRLNGQLLCQPGPLLHFMKTIQNDDEDRLQVLCPEDLRGTVRSYCETHQDLVHPSMSLRKNEPVLDPLVHCGSVGEYLESNPALEMSLERESAGHLCGADYLESAGGEELVVDLGLEDVSGSCKTVLEQEIRLEDPWGPYMVPMSVVQRWIDASDIVTPESRRCCCFTKSYTRYAKGTGSFLATKVSLANGADNAALEKHIRELRLEDQSRLAELGLRYFTPREVANMHSFPHKFSFPRHVTLKQRYALLGNSLSVAVVSSLLKYLFSTSLPFQPGRHEAGPKVSNLFSTSLSSQPET